MGTDNGRAKNAVKNGQGAASIADKVAPHSIEAEAACLGGIHTNPGYLAQVRLILNGPDDFFLLRNNYVYAGMLAVADRGEELDTLTLSEELRAQGRLDAVGGSAYLVRLGLDTPTSAHTLSYAGVVRRLSRK